MADLLQKLQRIKYHHLVEDVQIYHRFFSWHLYPIETFYMLFNITLLKNMSVNPQGALKTIDALLKRIDDLSKEEYDEESTVKEFAEIVFDVIRFVRLSVKGIKERSWYLEYSEFTSWSPNGVPIYSEFLDYSKKITIGIAYEDHIKELKAILYDCKKDFEMIKQIKGERPASKSMKKVKISFYKKITPIEGNWDMSKWDNGISEIIYLGPTVEVDNGTDPRNVAIALFEGEMEKGIISTKVSFVEKGSTIARVIIGYDSKTGCYYSVGIGGYRIAYLIDRFDPHVGWHAIYAKGDRSIIKREKTYQLDVVFNIRELILKIDNTEIFRCEISAENLGKQVGLFSWGRGNVTFKDIVVKDGTSNIEIRKKLFHGSQDRINIATASFENQDYISVFNNLNTALELFLKDLLDIPTTNTRIKTSTIINVMIKHKIGPIDYLKEAEKKILFLDNKIKHQGYNPSQIDCINAIKSIEELSGQLEKSRIIVTDEIKKKLFGPLINE